MPSLNGAGLRRGALVYVCARRIERLPPAAGAIARGSALLVVPGRLAGREASFAVAGCNGYAVTRRSLGSTPSGAAA